MEKKEKRDKKFSTETRLKAQWRIKMLDLVKILTKFKEIVSESFCNDVAKRKNFIKRSSSRLKGHEFAQALMIPNAFLEAESLNSLSTRMRKINKNCQLSAPALHQRINTKEAVEFMKTCYAKVLNDLVKQEFNSLPDLQFLSGFNRILIEDSTKVELHEKLSPIFKGAATKSGLKINYIFDYLSEEIVDIDFYSANIADQALSKRIIDFLKEGDLVIRDLGYYSVQNLREIELKQAYYISRLKSDVNVYETPEDTKPLDLARFIDKNLQHGMLDINVFIGKERHPTRLVACLMTEEAINKRRRKANRAAQRHGNQISTTKKELMKYCIFITNVKIEILSSIAITVIYRARWRIELIFKQWKSCLKINIFKGYSEERILCLLYGRLIMILVIAVISPLLMQYALKIGRELSCYKLVNYLIADHSFPRAFRKGKIEQYMNQLIKDLAQRLCMDKRQRPSLRKNIKMGNSYYNMLNISRLCA